MGTQEEKSGQRSSTKPANDFKRTRLVRKEPPRASLCCSCRPPVDAYIHLFSASCGSENNNNTFHFPFFYRGYTQYRPYRRRVHQSLAERLIFMSEQDVRVKVERQRGGRQSQVMTSSPSTGTGGSSELSGGRGGADSSQLLVLVGDAGGECTGRNQVVLRSIYETRSTLHTAEIDSHIVLGVLASRPSAPRYAH